MRNGNSRFVIIVWAAARTARVSCPEATVAETLNDGDDGDAQEERHQATDLGYELERDILYQKVND